MVPSCFLIDLDGTIWLDDRLIRGADHFVGWLIANRKPFRFITNNSSNSALQYVEKLWDLGIKCPDDSVFTSTEAAVCYLKEQQIPAVFPLGTETFVRELIAAGIGISENADCVLLAFDKTLTYQKADHALQLLRSNAKFIATHPDILCPTKRGYSLDCGAILAMLECASDRKAVVVGKPSAQFVNLVLNELDATAAETMVIGDRLYTDIRMGIDAGMKTALVLSGETKATDALPFHIDYVVGDIGHLSEVLEGSI
jgi:HAD superfamily hydrolase (TIGR01450 family)